MFVALPFLFWIFFLFECRMEGKRSHAIRHLSELKDTGEENLQYPEKKEKKEDKEIENEKENYCGEKKKRQKRPLSRAASTRAQPTPGEPSPRKKKLKHQKEGSGSLEEIDQKRRQFRQVSKVLGSQLKLYDELFRSEELLNQHLESLKSDFNEESIVNSLEDILKEKERVNSMTIAYLDRLKEVKDRISSLSKKKNFSEHTAELEVVLFLMESCYRLKRNPAFAKTRSDSGNTTEPANLGSRKTRSRTILQSSGCDDDFSVLDDLEKHLDTSPTRPTTPATPTPRGSPPSQPSFSSSFLSLPPSPRPSGMTASFSAHRASSPSLPPSSPSDPSLPPPSPSLDSSFPSSPSSSPSLPFLPSSLSASTSTSSLCSSVSTSPLNEKKTNIEGAVSFSSHSFSPSVSPSAPLPTSISRQQLLGTREKKEKDGEKSEEGKKETRFCSPVRIEESTMDWRKEGGKEENERGRVGEKGKTKASQRLSLRLSEDISPREVGEGGRGGGKKREGVEGVRPPLQKIHSELLSRHKTVSGPEKKEKPVKKGGTIKFLRQNSRSSFDSFHPAPFSPVPSTTFDSLPTSSSSSPPPSSSTGSVRRPNSLRLPKNALLSEKFFSPPPSSGSPTPSPPPVSQAGGGGGGGGGGKEEVLDRCTVEELIGVFVSERSGISKMRQGRTAFFKTYTCFTTSEEITAILLSFFSPNVPEAEMVTKCLRIIVFLKCWWEECFHDLFSEKTSILTEELLQEIAKIKPSIAKNLESIYAAKRNLSLPSSPSFVNFAARAYKSFNLKWDTFDIEDIAICLTLNASKRFSSIKKQELLKWNSKQKEQKCKNIYKVTNLSNAMSAWVTSELVRRAKRSDRVSLLYKFVLLAEILLDMNNFSSCMSVISGINSSAFYRMKKTWEAADVEIVERFKKMKEIMSHRSKYAAYRAYLEGIVPPCVPYIGVALSDLTFIDDGNDDFTEDGKVNFVKFKMMSKVVENIQLAQEIDYTVASPNQASFVKALFEYEPLSDDQAHQYSKLVETNNSEDAMTDLLKLYEDSQKELMLAKEEIKLLRGGEEREERKEQ